MLKRDINDSFSLKGKTTNPIIELIPNFHLDELVIWVYIYLWGEKGAVHHTTKIFLIL